MSLTDAVDMFINVVGIAAIAIVVVVILWDFLEVRAARKRGVTGRDACASCGKLHSGKVDEP